MCLPFFHKWKYELILETKVFWSSRSTVPMYHKYLYCGTCEKCGAIKHKKVTTE